MSNEKRIGIVTTISAILIAMFVAIPLVGAERGTAYSFNFVGPNFAMRAWGLPPIVNPVIGMDIEPGSYLRLVGAGTFDPSTGAVSGGGSYTHFAPDGTLWSHGIWTVVSFESFDSGLLIIIIQPTRIWSAMPGFEHVKALLPMMKLKISTEGFTVWGGPNYANPVFNEIVSGHVFFHLNG